MVSFDNFVIDLVCDIITGLYNEYKPLSKPMITQFSDAHMQQSGDELKLYNVSTLLLPRSVFS